MVCAGCQVKSRIAQRVFLVGISTVLQQKSDHFGITLQRCKDHKIL